MPTSQSNRAARFRELHSQPGVLLIGNPWDASSALLLQHLGFEALTTSSGAAAAQLGRKDNTISREDTLAQIRAMTAVLDVPLAGDLGKGFGDRPEDAGETIRQAAAAGLVGGSIEDSSGRPDQPIFDLNHATERVQAAVAAARALPFPFVLTARAENYLNGRPSLDDTIARLVRYAEAGADVLFAPALPDLAAVRAVCSAVPKPVNFMVGMKGKSFSVSELTAAGVKRISFATSLYRAAMGGLLAAAKEIKTHGTFTYLDHALPTPELNALLR